MARGGDSLIYCFLTGTAASAFLKSFYGIRIPAQYLFCIASLSFLILVLFYFRISLVTERGKRRTMELLIILFFVCCGALNDSRESSISKESRKEEE